MRWAEKIRVWLLVMMAIIIILLAVAFSVLRAVLPHATGYLQQIEQTLQTHIGLPVTIAAIDAGLYGFSPGLKVLDITVYQQDGNTQLIHIDEAAFKLSYFDTLFSLAPVIGDISLRGTRLNVERDANQQWSIQGIRISGADTSTDGGKLLALLEHGNLSLLESDIYFQDRSKKLESLEFHNVNLVIENLLGKHSVQMQVELPTHYGGRLEIIAEISGKLDMLSAASAEIYVSVNHLDLSKMQQYLAVGAAYGVRGLADVDLWLNVQRGEIQAVRGRTRLSQFAATRRAGQRASWSGDLLSAEFGWWQTAEQWRLDLKNLMLTRNAASWARPADIIVNHHAQEGTQLSATYLRLQDVLALRPLLEVALDTDIDQVLQDTAAHADIYNLFAKLPAGEIFSAATLAQLQLSMDVHGFGIENTAQRYKLKGIDAALVYQDAVAELKLFSNAAELEMAGSLREPLLLSRLEGVVRAENQGDAWLLRSEMLELANADLHTRTRLLARIPRQAGVELDVHTRFRDVNVAALPGYYPVDLLSDDTLAWLDQGLVGGRVPRGDFIFVGKMHDYPFAKNQGVMLADFAAQDIKLQYLPDWPAVDDLSVNVRLENAALEISQGHGNIYTGRIHNVRAYIGNLDDGLLSLTAEIAAPASDAQKFIWNSGLNSDLGDAMRQFQISNDIKLKLQLAVPLSTDTRQTTVTAEIEFAGNRCNIPALQYELTELGGVLKYEDGFLSAQDMRAKLDGAVLTLDVDAVRKPAPASVFTIRGRPSVDSLLTRFDWIPQHWFSGASDWKIAVHLPQAAQTPLTISLSSSLQGTALAVSDKLSKSAGEKLPLNISVSVLDDAMQIKAAMPEVLQGYATRDATTRWSVDMDSSLLRGDIAFDESFAPHTQVDIDLEYVDLYTLFKQDADMHSAGIKASAIPSIHFSADRLRWDAWSLHGVEVIASNQTHGLVFEKISLQGPAMTLSGHGSWMDTLQNINGESNFSFSLQSSNLGDTLSQLGYNRSIDSGKYRATINWRWLAEPYQFSLARVTGVAEFELKNGVIKDVTPGTRGRLVGLFNVLQLPKRLRLDFSDVYKSGFVFDTITGKFTFANGDANTDNLEIKASAADINISGRIGLIAEDYSLDMKVKPHSEAATFAGGTIAGGPVVGAGLVLLQRLLKLDDLTSNEYHITGDWAAPRIEEYNAKAPPAAQITTDTP